MNIEEFLSKPRTQEELDAHWGGWTAEERIECLNRVTSDTGYLRVPEVEEPPEDPNNILIKGKVHCTSEELLNLWKAWDPEQRERFAALTRDAGCQNLLRALRRDNLKAVERCFTPPKNWLARLIWRFWP